MLVAIIYVHQNCPICQSMLRFTAWRSAMTRKCVPILFRDVDHAPVSELRKVFPMQFDPQHGLVFRVVVPYLVIAEVKSGELVRILYRKQLVPSNRVGFSEPEVREIIYTTATWCHYGYALSEDSTTVGIAEQEGTKRRTRRKRGAENF